MTTLVGFLGAAESPEFSSERRAQLTAIATRQATALRNLLKGRLMVIVAHDRSERYEPLKRAFVLDSEVEVIPVASRMKTTRTGRRATNLQPHAS